MINIGIMLFPQVEELDFVGPFEVVSYINKIRPNSTNVILLAETDDPVTAANGMKIIPQTTLAECPALDILIIPGGKGRLTAMKNKVLLDFIRQRAPEVTYVASVCTGAFFLAEAGLLTGKKATTYHTAYAELAAYGVEVLPAKVVREEKIITSGGVSSGLELGFYLLRELFGLPIAQEVAKKIEYTVDIASL